MRGHGLMQAIARVNRVFKDKPGGLIVDYIGIAQNLKKALGQYSASDQKQTGKDLQAEAVAEMLERYDVVRCMFHGFNYLSGLHGTAQQRLAMMAGALDLIFSRQQDAAAKETSEEEKKRALRRYQDAVLALSKAFALAAASDQAKGIRDEVAFFQTVRAAMVKTATINSGMTPADKQFAVQQIIDGAVVSTEIVDILAAAGLQSPDIAILSDEFLAEIQQMEKKNLALEALKKLLNDQIRSRSRSNVTEQKRFSERLEDAIARYHSNAISTVEVLQELINLAKELRASRERGEDVGQSYDEIAFYDALAENQSAVEIMGDDALKVIAHELLTSLQQNITIDWAKRDSARARMRVLVKRILRRYGYPPDLQSDAVQTVLRQAEELSARWAA
jgi:type I restriction enzyme, R subunit